MYPNTEASVCAPDGETDFLAIHAKELQGDMLAQPHPQSSLLPVPR